MNFYKPAEDSCFLADFLKKYSLNNSQKILDLGCGSGIISETLINLGIKKQNITAADINPEAVKQTKKLNIKTKISDLFSNIHEKFDLIIFNPPYLPENKYDKEKDTTGGKKGDETILKFLRQASSHLKPNSKILLLLSSKTPKKRIISRIKHLNLKHQKKASRKLFFEELYIWEILTKK